MEPISPSLGQFSISLAVKDLDKSRAFYEALGFYPLELPAPGYGKKWLIMRHGDAVIGLFHGMFEHNTITFNPIDVRAVQRSAQSRGVEFKVTAADGVGPAHALAMDPDNNPVLLDQH
jgi:catechol 2,3-dioxygenase-like lactoylglutathione lyase family enzyme|nr:VOC family protein [Kofleriaceae bacterium]